MSLLFFCDNQEIEIFLDTTDTNTKSLEPIQPDVIGASSVVPPLQIEASEKV